MDRKRKKLYSRLVLVKSLPSRNSKNSRIRKRKRNSQREMQRKSRKWRSSRHGGTNRKQILPLLRGGRPDLSSMTKREGTRCTTSSPLGHSEGGRRGHRDNFYVTPTTYSTTGMLPTPNWLCETTGP